MTAGPLPSAGVGLMQCWYPGRTFKYLSSRQGLSGRVFTAMKMIFGGREELDSLK